MYGMLGFALWLTRQSLMTQLCTCIVMWSTLLMFVCQTVSVYNTDIHVVSMTCHVQQKASGKLPCVLNAVIHPNQEAGR